MTSYHCQCVCIKQHPIVLFLTSDLAQIFSLHKKWMEKKRNDIFLHGMLVQQYIPKEIEIMDVTSEY